MRRLSFILLVPLFSLLSADSSPGQDPYKPASSGATTKRYPPLRPYIPRYPGVFLPKGAPAVYPPSYLRPYSAPQAHAAGSSNPYSSPSSYRSAGDRSKKDSYSSDGHNPYRADAYSDGGYGDSGYGYGGYGYHYPAVTRRVTIYDGYFYPSVITIQAGSSIEWNNYGSHPHTATSDYRVWDTGDLAPYTSYTWLFQAPGIYRYHCKRHPDMVGVIVVR